MNRAELFTLLLRRLLDNLEPNESLHAVIMGGLPDELTDEQAEQASDMLNAMLQALHKHAIGQFRADKESNN